MDRSIAINAFPEISIFNEDPTFDVSLERKELEPGLWQYRLRINSEELKSPSPIYLRWKVPAINIKGTWKCGGIHDKRLRYDWELDHVTSRISVDAPIVSVFGHDDENRISFACSDAINLIESNALLREEDNFLYCHIALFTERFAAIKDYFMDFRIDIRKKKYYHSIQEISEWWMGFESMQPAKVPDVATTPLYSTWYQFHQELDEHTIYKECKIAHELGYELIILDDGWQTMDNNRGYDFTGDWHPERFPNLEKIVSNIHGIGMKFGLWFSVPFCGKKSDAYKRFKGKFLTENHRWAPVFDPRFPEVREYLIDIYRNALVKYNLDAFKLDFIDDFKVYPETELSAKDGRDYANVYEAVERLLADTMKVLKNIKPDLGIEFRQKYIGPVLKKYGNMFRAFDCPNDPVSNRIRITDVKLLGKGSATHSDPQTWHHDEPANLAALQVINGFFGVPQMSIILAEAPQEHISMLKHYTKLWNENKELILNGQFKPHGPLANYPILECENESNVIVGLYDKSLYRINKNKHYTILNGKTSTEIILSNPYHFNLNIHSYDCFGEKHAYIQSEDNLLSVPVPIGGMLTID